MDAKWESINKLATMSNEHVGAAAKALILTWLISADETRMQEPVGKLEQGVLSLLEAQARGQDTELLFHQIGFIDQDPPEQHDRDEPTSKHHFRTMDAGSEINKLLVYILTYLRGYNL